MKLQHGGFSIELPDDWSDMSTLMFVGPPEAPALPTVSPVQGPAESVTVSFVVVDDEDARTVLRQQAKALETTDPSFRVLDEGPFTCGLGEGHRFRQTIEADGVEVHQLCVACVLGPVAVVATASATAERFDRCAPKLEGILESMRAGR